MSYRRIRTALYRSILTVLLLVAAAPLAALAAPAFEAPFREFPSNPEALSLAYGDFDEDGMVDVIVATSGATADLVFMRQNPDHTFTASGSWAPADLLTQLVSGDFDGDGHLDIAGLDSGGNNVVAYFGDGNGGAVSSLSRPAPPASIFLAKANLNFGPDDLVAVSYWTSTIQAYVSLADTLLPLTPYTTEVTPSGIGVGDLNADGRDDLLLSHETVAIAEVLFTDITGAVGSALNVSIGSAYGGSAAIADANGDGLNDLLIGMTDGTGAAVSLNTGSGTYGTPLYYGGALASANFALRCADLDADGDRDIVLGGPQSQVLVNSGSGTFTSAGVALPPSVHGFADLYLTDVDGDTLPDVLAYGNYGSALIVARGNGDGTFGTNRQIAATYAHALLFSDIDGDSDADAVTINRQLGTVDAFARVGSALDVPVSTGMSFLPAGLATGRFNADTDPDFATVLPDIGEVAVLTNDGLGGFPAALPYATGEHPIDVVAGDLDGDGLDDLVVICSGGGETAAGGGRDDKRLFNHGLMIFRCTPGGFPLVPSSFVATGGCPNGAAIADVTQDGLIDLVAPLTCTGQIMVYPGIAPGEFGSGYQAASVPDPSAVAVRDVDAEGTPDIVALSSSGWLSTIINTGGGAFSPPVDVPTALMGQFLVVEDFDQDGNLDAAALSMANLVAVHAGLGGGAFGPRSDYGVCPNPTDLVAHDFDVDGDLDLVVASGSQQAFQYLRNARVGSSGVPSGPVFAMLDMRAPAPNPASGSVRLAFRLDGAARVTAEVFDVRGRKVRTLMSASDLPAGEHTAQWALTQDNGAPVPNGVYFARVRAGGREAVRKVFVTR